MITDRLQSLRGWHAYARKHWSRKQPKPSFAAWLRSGDGRTHLRDQIENADRAATKHLDYDFRGPDYHGTPWTRNWQPGMPINIGSGRRAEWCHIAYIQYAFIARLVHDQLGWSGQRVRDAAAALQRGIDGGGHDWEPPSEHVPTRAMLAMATLPPHWFERIGDVTSEFEVRRQQWRLWLGRVVSPAWGKYMLEHDIARLRRDPERKTPSGIVGEIRRLRGATDVADLRRCAGCQHLAQVASLDRETQDWLLSRTGEAQPIKLKEGLQGMHVPFGLPCAAEYDHCLVLGLNYEIRVRRADWDRLMPHQQSAVLR